jgi:GAF domain
MLEVFMTDESGAVRPGCRGRPDTRHDSSLTADPVARARMLHEVYDAVLSGASAATVPRSVVSESWRRSLAARVDPDRHEAPLTYRADDLDLVRAAHPLSAVLPMLRSTLVSIADEAVHIMVVTDAEGTILWREGAASLLSGADAVGLAPGTTWSEEAIGTNAMGTALAVDAPVSIHSAEHLVRAVHAWTCAAAPVHDPDTGAVVGAVDVTGPLRTAHPAMVALVAATAQLAENQLRVRLAIADEQLRVRNMPHLRSLRGRTGALLTPTGRVLAGEPYGGWPARITIDPGSDRVRLDDGREMVVEPLAEGYLLRSPPHATAAPLRRALSLRLLGEHPSVLLDGMAVPVTLRLAELLAVLALHPGGLTADQLAVLLYGDDGNPTTVRGEVLRLRSLIGADVLRTRPYRLDATVDTDFGAVRRALASVRPAEALRACAGPLLPRSDAPEIREERDALAVGLRRAVLAADDAELLAAFARHPLGRDDLAVHDRLLELIGPHDPRHPPVAAHRDRLLARD